MEFKDINAVPAPIQEFYEQVVINTPTGKTFKKVFFDKGYPETRDVEYIRQSVKVVKIPSGIRSTWSKVDQLVQDGAKQAIVEKFIAQAVENDRQNFHDEYLAWFDEQPLPEYDEEGNLLEAPVVGVEPVYVPTDTKVYFVGLAKQERNTGRYAPITVDGLTFDCDLASYENMIGTVDSWDTLINDPVIVESGIVVDGMLAWTLEDNTNTLVTKEQLQKVLDTIRVRAGLLHAQYQGVKHSL